MNPTARSLGRLLYQKLGSLDAGGPVLFLGKQHPADFKYVWMTESIGGNLIQLPASFRLIAQIQPALRRAQVMQISR